MSEPTETYVSGGQTIEIRFNASDLGGEDGGETAKIVLLYKPTRCVAGQNRVIAPPKA